MRVEGGTIAGIIDWGDMAAGDVATDLASVWMLFGDARAHGDCLARYRPTDALLARAKGWAVLFGAVLLETALVDHPARAAMGEATRRRVNEARGVRSPDLRIAVVGAGGAGGYFAARWCEAGLDVAVIARGPHLQAMRDNGLRLLSPRGDATVRPKVVCEPAAVASANFVLFATKTWQLEEAVAGAAPHLAPGCVVCGVQNGVGSAAELARFVAASNVLAATCRIISLIEEPGVIRHVGVDPTILIGEVGSGISDRVSQLSSVLTCGDKLAVEASPDIVAELWKKLLFLAPVSGVGTLTGSPIGAVRADPKGRGLLRAGIAEVAAVAAALGVAREEDAVERTLAFVDSLPAGGTSSMQRDFEAGRPTELEALSGAISRLGGELGVATPTHDLIVRSLSRGHTA